MSKYHRIAHPIRDLAQNPDVNVISQALTKGVEGLHSVAPNIAQSLQTTGSKAINYLHSKMSKPMNELIGDQEFEPTKTSQRRWLDIHNIVNDPISALDHVKHGTLTSDHMDALTQVHPELLNDMRQKVMEHMDPNQVRNLPMSTKLSLGAFLGSPITQSQTPQTVLGNQATFQAQQPQAPQSGSKSTLGGLKELNLAERSSTQTQELEAVKE